MTDDHVPDDHLPDGGSRDDELAARLAVPPLDELTRRRLVRHALDATPGTTAATGASGVAGTTETRRRRVPPWWAAAAAAVVVAVVVAVAVLASGGGSGGPTAARAPSTSAAPRSPSTTPGAGGDAATPSPQSRTASPSTAGVTADLGDLGEVSDPATLRTRVAGAEQRLAAPETFDDQASGNTAEKSVAPTTTLPCTTALATARPDLGPVRAAGRAKFHGEPATVVTATDRSGALVAVVIVDPGCVVHAPVVIPQ